MPALEKSSLEQKAVLWAFDSYGDDGEPVAIDASAQVDREIVAGGIMWLGEKDDLPSPVTDRFRVIGYSEIPDIKGREFYREVLLKRTTDATA
jgi:hypothetical protein